jgi:hypothetical protein
MDAEEIHTVVGLSHSPLVQGPLVSGQPLRGPAMKELVPQPGKADEADQREKHDH